MHEAGVDSMTMFQETYDEAVYKRVHLAGKKMDYHWRLNAPERAAQGGMRKSNWRPARPCTRTARPFSPLCMPITWKTSTWKPRCSASPCFNEAEGDFQPGITRSMIKPLQFKTALRIFLAPAGLTISTRECYLPRS